MGKLKNNIKTLGNKAVGLAKDVKTYWKEPKPGEYVSYKEFACFIVGTGGSIGSQTILGYFAFVASCYLVGSIYNIEFVHITAISFIYLPLSYIMNPLNMIITDNLGQLTKKQKILLHSVAVSFLSIGAILMFVPQKFTEQLLPALPQLIGGTIIIYAFQLYFRLFTMKYLAPKFGKFRPWVLVCGLPAIVCVFLMVFIPFNNFQYHTRLWTLNALFVLFGTFNVFCNQIPPIQNVISPNTEERGKVMAIGSFVGSIVPSVLAIFLPLLVGFTGGYDVLKTHQIIYPAFLVVMVALTYFLAFGVKEKVMVAKAHKTQISMKRGFSEVLKNKYFWITSISGIFACLSTGAVAMQNVIIVYTLREEWLQSIYATLIGTAYIPGMLLAPWLMKKVGKKNLMLISKAVQAITTAALFLTVYTGDFFTLLIFNYLNIFVASPANIAGSAMNADIWDYQQFKSGERLDGCSGIFGLITTPITTIGALCIPTVYGLLGFTSDWDILYYKPISQKVLIVTLAIGILVAVLSMIPFFFYDLTDKKHKEIMKVIQQRMLEEDGGGQENAEIAEVSVS